MATTHTAHRPRQTSRRAPSQAHARTSTLVKTGKTVAPTAAGTGPIEVVDLEGDKEIEKVVKAAAPKVARTSDSDDHLAAYFRQLAEHDLLTPEDERELSQGIEDTEMMTWERVLARPEVVAAVLELVEPNLEEPVKLVKLIKSVDDMMKSKKARKDAQLKKKHCAVAKEAAATLRALDLDRVHIDAVVRELYRAREAAIAGAATWWDEGASKECGQYLDDVRQAHRDAMHLRDEFVRANLRLVVTMARRYDRGG
ncbi:MAG TPA: sigma-70 factor domain-containing protein, partial [Myxococcota bacterium]